MVFVLQSDGRLETRFKQAKFVVFNALKEVLVSDTALRVAR